MVPETLKLMVAGVPDLSAFAAVIAARSEPRPLSLRLVTRKVATCFSLLRQYLGTI